MPTPQFSRPNESAGMDEIRNYLAMLWKELTYIMSRLDSKNMFEVGGWRVTLDQLAAKDGDVGMSTAGIDPTSIRFWAGNVVPALAPFRVQQNGKFFATDGELTGKITATSGTIGGWTIESNRLTGSGIVEGGTIRTASSGARVEITNGQIFVYDIGGLLNIIIDSTTSPPKINFYDSGVLKTSVYRLAGNFIIASDDITSVTGLSALLLGTGNVPTTINGTVKIRDATSALDTITQSGTNGATLAQLETQVNTIIQNLRAMNIYAT